MVHPLQLNSVRTEDYHTAGEPFRIVTIDDAAGPRMTVAQRRVLAQSGADGLDRLRQFLCNEPRGHADMYGGFVVPPDDDGADFGVLFWHKDGFSTACGHGTIALGVWAVETGRITATDNKIVPVTIDVPSGRVVALVEHEAGLIQRVTFRNVASHVIARDVPITVLGRSIRADLSFSGAIYASVPAKAFGLAVTPEHYTDLIAAGRAVKWALNDSPLAQHSTDPRLSGVYGTILYDELGRMPRGPHQRNVTVFADGEVDRSPCGSGTGARVALLAADGTLQPGEELTHDSIIGTRFTARFTAAAPSTPENTATSAAPGTPTSPPGLGVGGPSGLGTDGPSGLGTDGPSGLGTDGPSGAIIPEVTGLAHATGTHVFRLDPHDELDTGFVLR